MGLTASPTPGPPPAWTVVVPTYDRPSELRTCMASLAALRPPPGNFEIVVVNDGGSPAPADARDAAASGTAVATRFLDTENGGPGQARNVGVREARGRWIAFTDDDCTPDRDWLGVLDAALARTPEALVGGAVVNALGDNLFSEASQVLVEFATAHFDGETRERMFTANNLAVARESFLAAGGFDATFRFAGEDREFCDRWHAQGRPSTFESKAVVHHAHRLTLLSFLRQHRSYGRATRAFRSVRRSGGRPVRIDPGLYVGSVAHAARSGSPARGAALAGLTLVAHGAYLSGLLSSYLTSSRAPS